MPRTEIYVYQTTLINIGTSESDLQLCGMDASTVCLSPGDNAYKLAPGIYKICSSDELAITGDNTFFDAVPNAGKTNDPAPPLRATTSFAPLDTAALSSFMTAPDAKQLVNP